MSKWKLIDSKTGVELKVGDDRMTFRDVPVTISSLQPPHQPGSTGKVYVRHSTGEISVGYYPGVIGAKYIETAGRTPIADCEVAEANASKRTSPGFKRMNKRLGPETAERLRLDTVARQEAAMESVRFDKQVVDIKVDRHRSGPAILTDIINGKKRK